MIGFNNRFAAPVDVLTSYRAAGRFGEITHSEANNVWRGIPGRGSWVTSKAVAGGAIIDLGVHAIDLTLSVLEFPEIAGGSAITRAAFGSHEGYTSLHVWGDDEGPEAFDVEDAASAFSVPSSAPTARGNGSILLSSRCREIPDRNDFSRRRYLSVYV